MGETEKAVQYICLRLILTGGSLSQNKVLNLHHTINVPLAFEEYAALKLAWNFPWLSTCRSIPTMKIQVLGNRCAL